MGIIIAIWITYWKYLAGLAVAFILYETCKDTIKNVKTHRLLKKQEQERIHTLELIRLEDIRIQKVEEIQKRKLLKEKSSIKKIEYIKQEESSDLIDSVHKKLFGRR